MKLPVGLIITGIILLTIATILPKTSTPIELKWGIFDNGKFTTK